MPTPLSESLLRDLRVVDARIVELEIGSGAAACFAEARRAVLHIMLEGEAVVRSALGTALPLRAGDTALVFYGDRHRIEPNAGGSDLRHIEMPIGDLPFEEPPVMPVGKPPVQATVLSCLLELAYLSPSARAIRAAPDVWRMQRSPDEGGSAALVMDLDQIRRMCRGAGSMAFATTLANMLLVHNLRDTYRRMWSDQEMEIRDPGTRRVAAAVQALHAHPDRPWTVARLAQSVGLSRSSLAAAFTAHMGVPPLTYLTHIRMTRAAQLLEAEQIPITEVARRTGYPVCSSFTRAFAHHYGVSPRNFAGRKKKKGAAWSAAAADAEHGGDVRRQ